MACGFGGRKSGFGDFSGGIDLFSLSSKIFIQIAF